MARGLEEGERLFAFLDDLYVICRPDRVQAVHRTMVQPPTDGFQGRSMTLWCGTGETRLCQRPDKVS